MVLATLVYFLAINLKKTRRLLYNHFGKLVLINQNQKEKNVITVIHFAWTLIYHFITEMCGTLLIPLFFSDLVFINNTGRPGNFFC